MCSRACRRAWTRLPGGISTRVRRIPPSASASASRRTAERWRSLDGRRSAVGFLDEQYRHEAPPLAPLIERIERLLAPGARIYAPAAFVSHADHALVRAVALELALPGLPFPCMPTFRTPPCTAGPRGSRAGARRPLRTWPERCGTRSLLEPARWRPPCTASISRITLANLEPCGCTAHSYKR